ncbi:TM2 domain-containing protein CG10795 [Camponotus japonicus]
MTPFTKIIFQLLPLGIVLYLTYMTVYHSLNDYKYINAGENNVKLQVSRHQRAIRTNLLRYCKLNQYYDQEEKRCLGVPGGGKVLHVENGQSCGVNILKPHCTSSLYYHICKHDKSILAQCANRQIFDSRLQRCAYYDSNRLTPSTIRPDDYKYYEHVNVLKSFSIPNCTRLGQFPVPDHCSMFYTCDTNGHRLHQNVFKCPRNMGYQANRQVCAVVTDCENNDSVDTAICVPDAPGENVESLNSKEAINENVEETTGISEESETRSVSDSASKREESINSNIYDDVISTPESIIDNPLSVDNYEDNNDDLYKVSLSPTPSIQDISTSDGIDETSNQALSSTESALEIQNEKDDSVLDLRITSPPTVEFRDAYIMTPMTSTPVYNTDINSNVDPETADTPFSTVNYKSLKLDDRTQDITTESYNDDETATLPNSNIETLDSYLPTSTPFSSINDKSLNVDEETRDVTRAIDSYQTSTISNVPESSTIIDIPSKLYEEIQDTTEEYRNNDDKTMALLNSNTGAIDSTSTISSILEFPPTSETSKLYEEMQSATTEQYNNDDRIVTPSNSNIEVIDPILSDISATTNNPSDFDTSTLSSAILPQADINDDQYTKELFETSPSVDSKLVDPNLDVPEAIESVPTGYSSEHIDTLNLASTTTSPPQMDITPTIKDLPAISDTDLITQNGKDSTESSPFIEQDPITNN